jgi:hypothetical protein
VRSGVQLPSCPLFQTGLLAKTRIGSHGVTDIGAFEAAVKASRESGESTALLQKMGVVESSYYHQVDGSVVVVTHTFNELETAHNYRSMMESPEIQQRLERMGGILPVTFWLVEEM